MRKGGGGAGATIQHISLLTRVNVCPGCRPFLANIPEQKQIDAEIIIRKREVVEVGRE